MIIADDANDGTRLSFATRDKLVRRMRAADWDTVQKILNRLGKRGVELRIPIGTDKHGRPYYARAGMRSTYRIPEFAPRGDRRPPSPRADDGPTSTQGGQPSDLPSRADDGPRDADNHPGEGGRPSARRGPSSAPSPHSPDDSSSLSGGDDLNLPTEKDQRREEGDLESAIVDQLRQDTGTTIPATWVPKVKRAIFGGDGTPGPHVKHPPSYARKTIRDEPDKRGRFLPSPTTPAPKRTEPARTDTPTPPPRRTPDETTGEPTDPPMSDEERQALVDAALAGIHRRREAKANRRACPPLPPAPPPAPDGDSTARERARQEAQMAVYTQALADGLSPDEALRKARAHGGGGQPPVPGEP